MIVIIVLVIAHEMTLVLMNLWIHNVLLSARIESVTFLRCHYFDGAFLLSL